MSQTILDQFLKQSKLVGFISPPYHESGNKIPSGSITEWKNLTGEWRTGLKYSDNQENIGNLGGGQHTA